MSLFLHMIHNESANSILRNDGEIGGMGGIEGKGGIEGMGG